MSASNDKKNAEVTFIRYLAVTAFCMVFGLVYEHFSHGVYSSAMMLMFLYPLAGGVIPFGIIALTGHPFYPSALDRNIYDCGIATLTAGSCFRGALDIYGTTSRFSSVYTFAGIILTAIGIVIYIAGALSPVRRQD